MPSSPCCSLWRDIQAPPHDVQRSLEVDRLRKEKPNNDPVIGGICRLLQTLFNVSAASVALIDADNCWLRGPDSFDSPPVPRGHAICSYVLLGDQPEVFIIEDMTKDPRTQNSPMVTGDLAALRFYAGAPLISSSGHRIGVLCIRDTKPHCISREEARMLCNFAECIVRHLEEDGTWMAERRATMAVERSVEAVHHAAMMCDTGCDGWPIMFANNRWAFLTGVGVSALSVIGRNFWDLYTPIGSNKEKVLADFTEYRNSQAHLGSAFEVKVRSHGPDGRASGAKMVLTLRPAGCGLLDPEAQAIMLPAFLQTVKESEALNKLPYFFATSRPAPEDLQLSERAKRRLMKRTGSEPVLVLPHSGNLEAITELAESLEEEDTPPQTRSGSTTKLGSEHLVAERSFSGDSAMREAAHQQETHATSGLSPAIRSPLLSAGFPRSSTDSSRASIESLVSQRSQSTPRFLDAESTGESVSDGWNGAHGRAAELGTVHSGLPENYTLRDVEASGDSAASIATRGKSSSPEKWRLLGSRSVSDRGGRQPSCMCIIS